MKRKIKSTQMGPKQPTIGDTAWVIPNGRVRDPKTGAILPPRGVRLKIDQHWLRRRIDKDVVLSFAPATLKSDTPVEDLPAASEGSPADTQAPSSYKGPE